MTAPAHDLVVFGATSFVGRILTRYLVEHFPVQGAPLRWAIAGRCASRLEELKAALGAAGQSLPVIVADAADDARLQALWIAPFVMAAINERVVHRSNALSGRAYGSRFTYDEALLVGPGLKGRLAALGIVAGLGAFMLGIVVAPVRGLLERFVLPKPGEGPSPEAQLAGRYDLRFFGRDERGRTLRVKVTGDRDPGYGSTGKMLGQAAASLALDHAKGSARAGRGGGFWTPATMFDERLVQRLTQHAGLRFELLP